MRKMEKGKGISLFVAEEKDMENKSEQHNGIEEASRLLGVCKGTLRDWDKQKFLVPVRTPGGHRRYRASDIARVQSSGFETEQAK